MDGPLSTSTTSLSGQNCSASFLVRNCGLEALPSASYTGDPLTTKLATPRSGAGQEALVAVASESAAMPTIANKRVRDMTSSLSSCQCAAQYLYTIYYGISQFIFYSNIPTRTLAGRSTVSLTFQPPSSTAVTVSSFSTDSTVSCPKAS